MRLRRHYGDAVRNWAKIGGAARGVSFGRTARRWATMNVRWPSRLKTGKPVRGSEAVAERPDGTRYPFIPYPTPLRNDDGQLVGAVNMLVDITERKRNEEAAQHYAAIVNTSEDAILSKDLNGVITSWNRGAQRLFGYTSQEAVGKPVTMLIPTDRHEEEPEVRRTHPAR